MYHSWQESGWTSGWDNVAMWTCVKCGAEVDSYQAPSADYLVTNMLSVLPVWRLPDDTDPAWSARLEDFAKTFPKGARCDQVPLWLARQGLKVTIREPGRG